MSRGQIHRLSRCNCYAQDLPQQFQSDPIVLENYQFDFVYNNDLRQPTGIMAESVLSVLLTIDDSAGAALILFPARLGAK